LAFDGCFAGIFGLSDLLLMANRALASTATVGDQFEVSVLSAGAAGQRRWRMPARGDAGTGLDVLVVPGFEVMPGDDLDATLERGRRSAVHRRSGGGRVPVASVCVGAFLLGEAGARRRRATTSWFSRRPGEPLPDVSVTPEAIVAPTMP
jgi:transcriptional regulator GlxA family with amidase domain